MKTYRIEHWEGSAGFEKQGNDENETTEATSATEALRQFCDWDLTHIEAGLVMAENPEYAWKGCGHSDHWEARLISADPTDLETSPAEIVALLEPHLGNQREIAEALGVTQSAVSGWKSGKQGMGLPVRKLAANIVKGEA